MAARGAHHLLGQGRGLAVLLGGQRLRARGEEVFHCEFARVSTGVGVWIWAELVIADPVSFGSPVFVIFFLLEEIPLSGFG